ncbi:MAG: hypothetical protein M3447_02620 [Acidobacteriota bacterium]|nr:hypothetical protein [Acidobacteriota bacterium]
MRFKIRHTQSIIFFQLLLLPIASVLAQEKPQQPPLDVSKLRSRTVIRQEAANLGYGGTVTLVGAPNGSITIEGWARSEVALTAEIELRGATEEDLNLLALVNGFIFEESANHVRILSVGMHDKKYMRRTAKSFPKHLLGLPWKIDYRIRVPEFSDMEINAGRGPINFKGVEGSLALTATESVAQLTLSGGVVNATLGSGKLDVKIMLRSWRGTGADIRLAVGEMTVELPPGFNADLDASILRTGKIDNSFGELQPRQRNSITPQLMRARAGAGGPVFKFTVADGTINIKKSGL